MDTYTCLGCNYPVLEEELCVTCGYMTNRQGELDYCPECGSDDIVLGSCADCDNDVSYTFNPDDLHEDVCECENETDFCTICINFEIPSDNSISLVEIDDNEYVLLVSDVNMFGRVAQYVFTEGLPQQTYEQNIYSIFVDHNDYCICIISDTTSDLTQAQFDLKFRQVRDSVSDPYHIHE